MNTKPPIGYYGKTGTGALTALSAVGGQDTHLYCKKKNLATDYTHKEYTEGNTFYKVYKPIQDTYLGFEVRHVFKPKEMGDLLTSLMLSFELPGSNDYRIYGLYNHGYGVIEKASLLLNGEEIQMLYGDFMGIYESMYSSEVDRNNTLNLMTNMNSAYDSKPVYPVGDQKQRFLVPLPFFFNNHYVDSKMDTSSFRSPLPLCTLYNTEITLVVRFKRLDQIVKDTSTLNGTDITNLKFITEETVISAVERNEMRNRAVKFPIEKITKEDFEFLYKIIVSPTEYYYQYFFTYFLNSLYPARAILFYMKNKSDVYEPDFLTPITGATLNTLKKTDRGEERNKSYYQEYQAYTHGYHCNGLFYMFSFSELPLQVITGDYEYRAPKPQSAYLYINFYPESPDNYKFVSETYNILTTTDYFLDSNILLDTSLGGGGALGTVDSVTMTGSTAFRTDKANVGIPSTAYTNTGGTFPYNIRFNPYEYKYTRGGVDYFIYENPAPTYYDETSGEIRIDENFTYNGETIAIPAWSNSTTNTQALIIIKKSLGSPEWGTYTGNIYSLTSGESITVNSISDSWTSGKYYPTDQGLLDVNGYLLIIGDTKAQINQERTDVSTYQVSFYYFSTLMMTCEGGKATIEDRKNVFEGADEDKSGYLEPEELESFKPGADLERFDNDKDKRISYGEFNALA